MTLAYKVSSPRGANNIHADARTEESTDGLRRVSGRNVKRSLGDGRYDSVRVFTLKKKQDGKWVVVARGCGLSEAYDFFTAFKES